ncbi:MAG: hypothetical protein NC305_12680 [Lachnospiraceae bacterium]|nr:hypothetical protein [Butyrivibrio sp.]MCM1342942.1 hypothetical protein [Muribaculaceae bacterium]MCM1411388.1 hypothetical protein [Lachnospiraceae bacterium]
MKKDSFMKLITRICYGILILFMLTILLRIFTRAIIVERLRVENNLFVNALFFDQMQLASPDGSAAAQADGDDGNAIVSVAIDWAALYPFTYDHDPSESTVGGRAAASILALSEKLNALENKVNALTDKISYYATDLLIGRQYFVGKMNQAEQLIGWDIADHLEYNGVVALADGRLTGYIPRRDVSENARSVIDLKDFCDASGYPFLYVQSPYAVCKIENADVSNVLDFSNQNADDLLEQLTVGGVEYLDMRQSLHEDGLIHADAFYRTDHHWKAETGLWAAGELAQYLNEMHDFSIDTTMLAADQFTYETYPSWFLGSGGTKLTIAAVDAEDFTMIYPKYETLLRYEIPESAIDEIGDFSVTYDMNMVATTGGYSEKNSYAVYNHGTVTEGTLQNQLCSDGKRILIIQDSFTRVVTPFLACTDGVSEINVLDVRYFTGSVQAYIREKDPDIVIIWYNPSVIDKIDWNSHTSTFDFR